MHRRSTLLTVAALSAVAALSLSACGSGDESSKGNDKIAGADLRSEASPPTPSASTAGDRPKIEVPSDITYDFAWTPTGDAEKGAVLADVEQRIKAVDMAIADQNALDRGYRFYTAGPAAAGTQQYIQQYIDHKARTTGRSRFYNENLTVRNDGTASLVYCGDQSRAYNKDLSTGRTDVTPVTEESYVIYAGVLRRNKNGVWVTERMTSRRGSSQCRP